MKRGAGVLAAAQLITGCALFPGHYVLESHYVRSKDEMAGIDLVWFQFLPSYSSPSKKLTVYGSPYTLSVTIYAEKRYDSLVMLDPVFLSETGDILFSAKRIRFELLPMPGKGKQIDGKAVFSSIDPRPPVQLPYGRAIKANFGLRYPSGETIAASQEFHWVRTRYSHNRAVDRLLSW